MMFPTQSMAVLAETNVQIEEPAMPETTEEETERIEETLPLETIETEENEGDEDSNRIEETLPLEPIEENKWDEETVIYWNPGGVLPENLATASNAHEGPAYGDQKATSSNAKRGSDRADGLSPSTPVKTLEAALERAEAMQKDQGISAADITIYAMNPLEISDGELYILTGGHIRIVSWPGRTYESDTIFYVNGGQLTLINTRLEPGSQKSGSEEAELILVRGGNLQMGQGVEIDGRITMDYRDQKEELAWDIATDSNASLNTETATASDAEPKEKETGETTGFDINDYILDSDEDCLELQRDSKSSSTWKAPIIELLEDFHGTEGSYVLGILGDTSQTQMELVRTLYADTESEEDFEGLFALSEFTESVWKLEAESQATVRIRDTGSETFARFAGDFVGERIGESEDFGALRTQKTLKATQVESGQVIYWNPGGQIIISPTDKYSAGSDIGNDGNVPIEPVRSWSLAREKANGGTIVCMQSVVLGTGTTSEFIGEKQADGSYLIESSSAETMVTLKVWDALPQPVFVVPKGEKLQLNNIILEGIEKNGAIESTQTILCQKGDIVIDKNVTAETGYIQIDAFKELEKHPVTVNSVDLAEDGKITLFVGGINKDLSYRYTDIVVPGEELEDAVQTNPEEVGEKLLKRFRLDKANSKVDNGGQSQFDWALRQDTNEDDDGAKRQNLELYSPYYYEAIYLDGVRGDDENFGANCQYPVKTWKRVSEIWETEMDKSIEAREAAKGKETKKAIEEKYPLPKIIYICGEVTVDGDQTWKLSKKTDYDGTDIITELISHTDIPKKEDVNEPVHELPKNLIKVVAGGDLTLEGLLIRNITNEKDSNTILVENEGALTLTDGVTGGAVLTGGDQDQNKATYGTHVSVHTGGKFTMNGGCCIEKRQHGIVASGVGTTVIMNGGEIRDNNSFDQVLYDADDKSQDYGAGVTLLDGVAFMMNDGKITGNTVYQFGGGIYMTGNDTTFTMVKGEISENKMAIKDERGYGIGIYAGTGTILNIGNKTGNSKEVLITKNRGYSANGVGIWTNGTLKLTNATVSENGTSAAYNDQGGGIYAGSDSLLQVESAQITDNQLDYWYSTIMEGAGIYFNSWNQGNYIKSSNISKNILKQPSDRETRGGGIYVNGNLNIEDCTISENAATTGGGIYLIGSYSTKSELTVKNTSIVENMANAGSGSSKLNKAGGGIYAGSNGSITLLDGTAITSNRSGTCGGGICLKGSGSELSMKATTPGAIVISKNSSSQGGGVWNGGGVIYAKFVKISENRGTGGGLYSSGKDYFKEVEIDNSIGSGVYSSGSGSSHYFWGCTITASNGSGVSSDNGVCYFTDCAITNNKATNGGGIYLTGDGKIYLTETTPKKFKLSDNIATNNGGGIYTSGSSSKGILYLDIEGEIQNVASEQGSNIYTSSEQIWLTAGHFLQPEEEKEGVYNIYADITSSAGGDPLYLDLSKATFEKKETGKPDVIFLNTSASYLSYLRTPPSNIRGTFPIDVNTEVFKVGTVVVKPAAVKKLTLYRVNEEITEVIEGITEVKDYSWEYDELMDASQNVNYSTGDLLPKRTQLGGYEDSKNTSKTNVVIVGEGVYLSSSTGKNEYDGLSPSSAVKTFERATEVQREQIEAIKAIEDGKPDSEKKMGFTPFIYICGNVRVTSNETWILDDDNLLFTETNANYIKAEGENAYPAQVRRFASFVDEPMITVADETAFTTGKIIIDGMSEAIVPMDQGDQSPIIKGEGNSKVTLTGDSYITNNYYGAVNIFGTLILTGELGDLNKQLAEHHGYSVRLEEGANLEMNGYSRILSEKKIKKIGNEGLHAVVSAASNVEILMKGDSSITRLDSADGESKEDYLLTNGIYTSGGSIKIEMQDNATIENLKGSAIFVNGTKSEIYMQGEAAIENHSSAISVYSKNTKIEMQGKATISSSGGGGIDVSDGEQANIRMSGEATIKDTTYDGIRVTGKKITIQMTDKAVIENSKRNGIYVSGTEDNIVQMQKFAEIRNCDSSYYGIRFYGIGSLSMNMNEDADEKDSAKIINSRGIEVNGGIDISLGRHALIDGGGKGYGVYYNSSSDKSSVERKLELKNSSRITNSNSGILFYNYKNPIHILMTDDSAIDQCSNGIGESFRGIGKLRLEMEKNSRISGNLENGISFTGQGNNSTEYHEIIMKDNTIIGGSESYDIKNEFSGNGKAGIYSNTSIDLQMSGESRISGNGLSGTDTKTSSAVYLERIKAYYRRGTSKITLSDNASICNNRGGVYAVRVEEPYSNPCEIILDGEKGEPSIQNNEEKKGPSIQDNGDAVYLMEPEQIIKLKGTTILGKPTDDTIQHSLECYGKLELDGRSIVEAPIMLRTGANPITMTHKVDDPLREYHLWLEEGFLGQIVVQPNDPDGLTKDGIKDVTDQLKHFIKDGADGLAANKTMVISPPNIVLGGENDVYIAGDGNDANNGNSPSTPVRTFKRAKELLETGYFTEGANIIICNSMVTVLEGDETWSFDNDGRITNENSKDTWKPILIRYKDFKGQLIGVGAFDKNNNYAQTVVFKNITIDGGSEQGMVLSSNSKDEILYVYCDGTASLEEGAILQNNKSVIQSSSVSSAASIGVFIAGGTLEIDGGIIRNLTREFQNSVYSSHNYASAVLCQSALLDKVSYKGKFIMKSGQIVENQMIYLKSPSSYGSLNAAAVVLLSDCEMEMSGGIIANNKTSAEIGQIPYCGGGLLVNYGKATISGGIIRNNEGGLGSGIYYNGSSSKGSLIMSGGQVVENFTNLSEQPSQGEYSPVYIFGYDFQLKGGGADIRDNIYLRSTQYLIKVSGNIYQKGRLYHVFLNQSDFKKGSTVVQPDGNWMTDATPYLAYFQVHSNPYVLDRGQVSRDAGTVEGVKESHCLILMKGVYLDSEGGDDNAGGTTPGTAVKSFTKAKQIGSTGYGQTDYYIIYISGKAINKESEPIWSLPEPSYMSRYTGFPVYSADGSGNQEKANAYHGYLIEPAFNLTLDGISIYGRRSIDTIANHGDSLVHIKEGIRVTVQEELNKKTIVGRNYNIGEYFDHTEGEIKNLGTRGGAFRVDAGGILDIQHGTILDTEAAYGSAIYLGADTESEKFGHLYLAGSPSILGKTYLSGTKMASAYIEPSDNYTPLSALELSIENDYDQRPVIKYPEGTTPGYEIQEYFRFDDSIKSIYDIVNSSGQSNVVGLSMRGAIYLDGKNGNDDSDGATPATAYKTLKKVYESINKSGTSKGTLVFVVNTVEVSGSAPDIALSNIKIKNEDGTSSYKGKYKDTAGTEVNIDGQVYFKRYAQPDGYAEDNSDYTGFEVPTLMNTLFCIKNEGKLTLNGICVDGHSEDSAGAKNTLVARGVQATSPLVTVEKGGELISLLVKKDEVPNGVDTATIFVNNINTRQKKNVIGTLNDLNVIEGSGSGIELLGGREDGGKCTLESTEFNNLKLGDEVLFGGTDVYSHGDLHFSNLTIFGGSVFLEGFGSADDLEIQDTTSCYLTVDQYGVPVKVDFEVLMRDPYAGRYVVHYPERADGPDKDQIGRYHLDKDVKDYFMLGEHPKFPYIYQLQVPKAIYIDGINGDDCNNDQFDAETTGSNPSDPIKTLKRAFELLQTRIGSTIYVVDTIQITSDVHITGTLYEAGDDIVSLGNMGKVKITRYVQPDFARADNQVAADTGYDVEDFTGVLLNVSGDATAIFDTDVFFDGHSEPKNAIDYVKEYRVDRTSEAKAPLIKVEAGSALELGAGVILQDNNNTYQDEDSGMAGGVLYNSGITTIYGASFTNNKASQGSGVYQDGTFTILGEPEKLAGHSFYLTTENTGSFDNPVWGKDHVIQTAVIIPDGQIFDVDMDHAVKGRDVVRFTDTSAFTPNADAEHEHFKLGETVPQSLFLVEDVLDEMVLELQNWEVFDVEVPANIYLVVNRKANVNTTTKLSGIRTEAEGSSLFSAPEYTIKNKGIYDVEVSMKEFVNQSSETGITGFDDMNLTETNDSAIGETDLYLAVKGLDDGSGGTGFTIAETSLKPYAEEGAANAPAKLGVLKAKTDGNFTFVGEVGEGFIEKYQDPAFPVKGKTREEAQQHMDGTSEDGSIHARAKYGMKYRLEMVPSRQNNNIAP